MKIGNFQDPEGHLISRKTRGAIKTGRILLLLHTLLAVLTYFSPPLAPQDAQTVQNLYGGVNFMVILHLIIVFSLRKTIYLSRRTVPDGTGLPEVLERWNRLDTRFLSSTALIPLAASAAHCLGLGWAQLWHLFLTALLFTLMLMPMGIKVRSRLGMLRRLHPDLSVPEDGPPAEGHA